MVYTILYYCVTSLKCVQVEIKIDGGFVRMKSFNVREIPKLIVSILVVFLAGAVGTVYTLKQITTWYVSLIKPSWTSSKLGIWTYMEHIVYSYGNIIVFSMERRFRTKRCENSYHCICRSIGDKRCMVNDILCFPQYNRRFDNGNNSMDIGSNNYPSVLPYFKTCSNNINSISDLGNHCRIFKLHSIPFKSLKRY